jgi:hypothetical protein
MSRPPTIEEPGPVLWRRLAMLLIAFLGLPFSVSMLLAYALPDLTGWLFFGGIAMLFVAWFAGGGAASHVRPRNYVINARFTSTENTYRFGAMLHSAGLMIVVACTGIGMMIGAGVGYQLSLTV